MRAFHLFFFWMGRELLVFLHSPSRNAVSRVGSVFSSPARSFYDRYELSIACIRNISAINFCFFFLIFVYTHYLENWYRCNCGKELTNTSQCYLQVELFLNFFNLTVILTWIIWWEGEINFVSVEWHFHIPRHSFAYVYVTFFVVKVTVWGRQEDSLSVLFEKNSKMAP